MAFEHGREGVEVALGESLHVLARDAAVGGGRYAVDGLANYHCDPVRRGFGNWEKESPWERAGRDPGSRREWCGI